MTQIPILNGIFADATPEFRTSYPINFTAVPRETGISNGYLRPADGIRHFANLRGMGRGGIVWNGDLYRVTGTELVKIDALGASLVIGDVGPGGQCRFDYSFDRLAIASNGNLFYWDGALLQQVTDSDLGTVNDVIWVDGYFMTTDGEFLVVTDLNDPFAVNPLKFGSSEIDPDPVLALIKLRNEVYAINRDTIEVFTNVGGALFPFQRIEGAQIQKGAVGRDACCVYLETIAFVGSTRNEAPSVYLTQQSSTIKISTQEIDQLLEAYTEQELALVLMEARNDRSHQLLYIHLPDRSLVYDAAASQAIGEPVWTIMTSSVDGFARYRAKNFLYYNQEWHVEDTNTASEGVMVRDVSSHWGMKVRWEFGTRIVYNDGAGAIMSRLELVGLTGSVTPLATIGTSYSVDGVTWSQTRYIGAGGVGDRAKRLVWFRQGNMRNWRIQRFQGTSDAHISFARLEAQLDPLAW